MALPCLCAHTNTGAEPSARREVWKFLLGVYPHGSSAASRQQQRQRQAQQYAALRGQWASIGPDQARRWAKWRERRSRIDKDVRRTDRWGVGGGRGFGQGAGEGGKRCVGCLCSMAGACGGVFLCFLCSTPFGCGQSGGPGEGVCVCVCCCMCRVCAMWLSGRVHVCMFCGVMVVCDYFGGSLPWWVWWAKGEAACVLVRAVRFEPVVVGVFVCDSQCSPSVLSQRHLGSPAMPAHTGCVASFYVRLDVLHGVGCVWLHLVCG